MDWGSILNKFIEAAIWFAAIMVSLIPGLLALDSGGALPWTYWAASVLVLPPTFAAFLCLRDEYFPKRIQPHLLTFAWLALAAYALIQTINLPASIVSILSPGVWSAWNDWQVNLPGSDATAVRGTTWLPLSIAPLLTANFAATFAVIAGFSWCGSMLFHSRNRIVLLLFAFTLMGAVHAALGLWQVFSHPDQTLWGVGSTGSFGVFVNRNNAALLLNVGLAANLGIIGWRLATVTGHEFGQQHFNLSMLLDLISDRMATIASVLGLITVAGLLACGSRGGLAGMIVGGSLAIGLFRSKYVASRILIGVLLAAVVAIVLLGRIELAPKSLERFGATGQGMSESILTDDRIPHWMDSFNGVKSYLPSGSGFGTYRFAYLPFQNLGNGSWFLNADNLWLEWMMEGGIFVCLLLLIVFVLMCYALVQLRNTPDPIDHGVATAGWFLLGAVLFTQSFDFGLVLVGAASSIALLASLVMSRSAQNGIPLFSFNKRENSKLRFTVGFPKYRAAIVGAVAVVSCLFGSNTLHSFAVCDASIRQSRANNVENTSEVSQTLEELKQLSVEHPSNFRVSLRVAELYNELADIELRRALTQLAAFQDLDVARSRLLMPSIKKLRSLVSVDPKIPQSDRKQTISELAKVMTVAPEELKEANRFALQSLAYCPLSPEPRFLLAQINPSSEAGPELVELLEQLFQLRCRSEAPLRALAELAAEFNQWELATRAWKRTVELRPVLVSSVLTSAQALGHPAAFDIVPDDDQALLDAGEIAVRQAQRNQEFLQRVRQALEKAPFEEKVVRTRCHVLMANIYYADSDFEKADGAYLAAIKSSPLNMSIRKELIDRIMSRGDYIKAKSILKIWSEEFGGTEARVEQMLDSVQKSIDRRNKLVP